MIYKAYCRGYQKILQLAAYFLKWRRPVVLEGEDSFEKLSGILQEKNKKNVLIVTGPHISAMGLTDDLLKALNDKNISCHIYNKTVANPTTDNVDEAYALYCTASCDTILAFGGGSPMDCAKGVGARAANPNKSLSQMKGLLRVRKKLPLFIAVPTTAGTGSETTLAAVISDAKTHEKFQVNDVVLIPHYAILDPDLTTGLPPAVTAATGMDAATHAIEAYIGRSNTAESKEYSQKAIKLIFENLYTAYSEADAPTARMNMLKASHFAGIAFTRAYVGYVHAVAHAVGGVYGFSHGMAVAVILPHALTFYGASVYHSLSELAEVAGIAAVGDTAEEKAKKFIDAIHALNRSLQIPEKLTGIKKEDYPLLITRILKEANPFYPVPKLLFSEDIEKLLTIISE